MPSAPYRLLYACLLCLATPLLAQQAGPVPPLTVPGTDSPASPLAAPMPAVDILFNGRQQQIPVEDLANPMVIIQTTRGNMLFELFRREAPETVANFIGLAEGTKPWLDPITNTQQQAPFYDGLTFHRVVDDFLIQGGSPTGDSTGTPGYVLPNEINASSLGLDRMGVLDENGEPNPVLGIRSQADFQALVLKPLYADMGISSNAQLASRVGEVDQRLRALSVKQLYEMLGYRYRSDVASRAPVRGVIAMANAGPGTNGSQFFITLADTEWLLGRYTVFGKIRAGSEILDAIGKARVDLNQRPQPEITILAIRTLPTTPVTP